MVHRISNRKNFIALIGGLVIGEIFFTIFDWSKLLLLILSLFYILVLFVNYFLIVPQKIRKKYKENPLLSQKRCFYFYDGMKFEFQIYKVAYYDDVIYIISENNQAMMIKKEWLKSGKSWEEFIHFIDHKVVPKITPKIYRR